ncbi:MAG: ribose 5-phosphate isomerase B [Bacteroidia bacterium]
MIGIAADHAGFLYKEILANYLLEKGYEVKDFGTHSLESSDYPDFAHPLSEAVSSGTLEKGVAVCGSGEGMCITANKHQGVRAALVWNEEVAALSRQHNDANILCLPSRFISIEKAKELVDIFFSTEFEGGRHSRRVSKI